MTKELQCRVDPTFEQEAHFEAARSDPRSDGTAFKLSLLAPIIKVGCQDGH